ncbi:hypothetical protein GN244_ATG02963 [Phytophthora infestans]|uniref:Uncharacterized protein n=1 Tax=Phytophthora infestans TaxID=4787 RepID=A0A833X0R5_PHYIN|nr:hypothetical protein GN244_ATG02963 [Phytophthora infestans]KAF4140103.1 hypothetical protein GN958_ATG10712 [Phytophthora infestans]
MTQKQLSPGNRWPLRRQETVVFAVSWRSEFCSSTRFRATLPRNKQWFGTSGEENALSAAVTTSYLFHGIPMHLQRLKFLSSSESRAGADQWVIT